MKRQVLKRMNNGRCPPEKSKCCLEFKFTPKTPLWPGTELAEPAETPRRRIWFSQTQSCHVINNAAWTDRCFFFLFFCFCLFVFCFNAADRSFSALHGIKGLREILAVVEEVGVVTFAI